MTRAKQIFDKNAKKHMVEWDLNSFRKSHATLYDVILTSINEALKENNK